MIKLVFAVLLATISPVVFANTTETGTILDLTGSWPGYLALAIFALGYLVVIGEDFLHIRKSKPMLLAAGLIWLIVGAVYSQHELSEISADAFNHNLLEYSQLLLFLLVSMTYINALEERHFFDAIRLWLLNKGFNLRTLFWVTGIMAFAISSFANNLTTAMLMCAIILKMAKDNRQFITIACINIVVAVNAGGAFSPFGDITTLMVWQSGKIDFFGFFVLFVPAVVNYLVPAAIMSFFVSKAAPDVTNDEDLEMKRGAIRIFILFILTIATAVIAQNFVGLPAVMGMMLGLAYLKFFGFYLRKTLPKSLAKKRTAAELRNDQKALLRLGNILPFDVFSKIANAEWDTLLFFYGVVMCIGGLGFIGYLSLLSGTLYSSWDPTWANVFLGLMSAVVDNIPVMYAVLEMDPNMPISQWLLITMTAGVGGSMLSVGSAAGVALMGQTKGIYNFTSHMKWSWVVLLGYIASIAVHLWLNG
ncbi:sodium:proton antiporter NhaD [Porticoccaceae bacterium LTM1]|nr:sodium:proton antiporter NhaD [Porticoccaceae bacterium LTM1]